MENLKARSPPVTPCMELPEEPPTSPANTEVCSSMLLSLKISREF